MRIGRSSSRPQPLADDRARQLAADVAAALALDLEAADAVASVRRRRRASRRASPPAPRRRRRPRASTCTYIVSAPRSRAVRLSGVSTATTRPLLMMTTRWQVCATSGRMCVLRMIVWSPARLLDQLARLDDLLRIEAGGRLVEDQHVGVVNERLRQADALPVALRQLAAVAVRHVGDARALHDASSTRCLPLARRHALDAARRSPGTRARSCRGRAAAFPADSRCGAWPRSAGRTRRSRRRSPCPRWPACSRSGSASSWSCRRRSARGSRGSRRARRGS